MSFQLESTEEEKVSCLITILRYQKHEIIINSLCYRNEMEAYQKWLNQMIEDGRLEKRVSRVQKLGMGNVVGTLCVSKRNDLVPFVLFGKKSKIQTPLTLPCLGLRGIWIRRGRGGRRKPELRNEIVVSARSAV